MDAKLVCQTVGVALTLHLNTHILVAINGLITHLQHFPCFQKIVEIRANSLYAIKKLTHPLRAIKI
jgi:hypothetical protein